MVTVSTYNPRNVNKAFKDKMGVDKRVKFMMAAPPVQKLYLDTWYETDQLSYDQFYGQAKLGNKLKTPKGLDMISSLCSNNPHLFHKIWNRKPFKELNSQVKALF